MKTSKMDKLGRVVIPVEYRNQLKLRENDPLILSMENGGICIRPCKRVCRLCGDTVCKEGAVLLCNACIEKVKQI